MEITASLQSLRLASCHGTWHGRIVSFSRRFARHWCNSDRIFVSPSATTSSFQTQTQECQPCSLHYKKDILCASRITSSSSRTSEASDAGKLLTSFLSSSTAAFASTGAIASFIVIGVWTNPKGDRVVHPFSAM